ncbi:MAG: hypothetical protein JWN70_537 [Planctomycetaceae bacterium]|nr:hypothetical protein [Planctomycetaceae bacterium]
MLPGGYRQTSPAPPGNAVKDFVAELAKSSGRIGHGPRSLGDFGYEEFSSSDFR